MKSEKNGILTGCPLLLQLWSYERLAPFWKDDPFLKKNIRKALSKLNASSGFNACPSGEVFTAQALRGLLNEYHEKYRRICAIAELPYSGFSRTEYKIMMLPPDYEKYVQVWCP